MAKHDCYNCLHREKIVGDAHSSCNYPKSVETLPKNVVSLNAYGVSNGWANWPYNFDPTWVSKCKGYEEKTK
jgi:hypothetical protein